ncbi:MAG TPA: hypothetical protein VE262_11660, partial [Blastocatellia bacterium]|nr:hypothetical protein [Blastocatellia bacterium]
GVEVGRFGLRHFKKSPAFIPFVAISGDSSAPLPISSLLLSSLSDFFRYDYSSHRLQAVADCAQSVGKPFISLIRE